MAKKLLGSGSKGRTQNKGFKGSPRGQKNLLNHSLDEPLGKAQERTNLAIQGKMLNKQLKKNKSKGMKP
jgi:hypothetical protein